MKKKILIGIIIALVVSTSIFVIFVLGKKDGKTIIPTPSDKVSSTSRETSEVTTEETFLTTEETTTTVTTTIKTTKKSETTKKTTTKKSTTTLDYKKVKETISEESTKYGVVIKDNYEVTYKVYNDGRKEEISKKKKNTTYDSTNFKATTEELRAEATTVSNSNKSTYDEMLTYVNNYRSEVNVEPLAIDNDLNLAATIRALEMAYSKKFSHTRPDGSMCDTVLDDLKLKTSASGENIAYGQRTVAAVSEDWKNSKGHYGNMISASYNKVGFGKFSLNGVNYWVQLFEN